MATSISSVETWTKSLKYVPELGLDFAKKWGSEEVKVPRKIQARGYGNFCEGYIFDVEGKTISPCPWAWSKFEFCMTYFFS